MNHFLLPEGSQAGSCESFGANAMELLINALIREGASKSRLRAKVFGGAAMCKGLTTIGLLNGQFVLDYLAKESIPCDGHSLGGELARRVEFTPCSGRARQRLVSEKVVEKVEVAPPASNDIELF
ncbi:chemotaxis protein CheD [Celeribacter sp.]|uniref:chemotaxis protein CheD n=1 Tax=Celeribacter sp. TaxID=1890673 RepID=UPI003A8DA36F